LVIGNDGLELADQISKILLLAGWFEGLRERFIDRSDSNPIIDSAGAKPA
jgi:hypothetical protein